MEARMSASGIPATIEQLGGRTFSFYPAIIGIDHNEWSFKEATWSEALVINAKSGEEIWVPRRSIGQVAKVEEPMAIVGLNTELEFRNGSVVPHNRRVIEMPKAVNEGPRPGAEPLPSDMKAPSALQAITGVSNGTDSKIGKMLLTAIAAGILLVVLVIGFIRGSDKRVTFTPVVQSDIVFGARDDYFAVERRLGKPAEDKWRSDQGEIQYRYLWYPQQGMAVILMGTDRGKAQYIGELDQQGRVIHSVDRNMEQILRRFKNP
jgi:hypothetical protein